VTPASIEDVERLLAAGGYVAGRRLATAVFLALRLGRPLFLEGEAGVGKTELTKVLAAALGRPLIRLQCYEGLDVSSAVYEWNVPRQMLAIRLAEARGTAAGGTLAKDLFSREFLVERPILRAIEAGRNGPPAVLLVDELDRADEPFEAYLLEVLSDFQVTIPELGAIESPSPPLVVLTSNRTREVHDAIKRRCLYHWLDYPDRERELSIVRQRVPQASAELSQQVARFTARLRSAPFVNAFQRAPGIAESVEWARALVALDTLALDPEVVADTAGILFKQREDIAALTQELSVALLAPQEEEAA